MLRAFCRDRRRIRNLKSGHAVPADPQLGQFSQRESKRASIPPKMGAKAEKCQLNQWEFWAGALGGTRTPTILLTATSRQRVYQFRHERVATDLGTRPEWAGSAPSRRRCNKWIMPGQGLAPPRPTIPRLCDYAFKTGVFCRKDAGRSLRVGPALALVRRFRPHPLHLDGDAVAIHDHRSGGDRQDVGQHLVLVLLGGFKFDDGPAAHPHDLVNRHFGGPENHHEIDGNVIDCCHYYT